jgi:hypothetical protein
MSAADASSMPTSSSVGTGPVTAAAMGVRNRCHAQPESCGQRYCANSQLVNHRCIDHHVTSHTICAVSNSDSSSSLHG